MQKQIKQSRISIKSILCVSILIIGISIFSTMRLNATTVSYDPMSYSSLTPHAPISINSDSGLEVFHGSGTVEDPYIIEGYNITTTDFSSISISWTSKYFVIRNCYIEAGSNGISISNVADGTATVINNTCSNNNNGIDLYYSDNSTVANNNCSNNNNYGISLDYSDSSTVEKNTCNNNWNGITIFDSDFCNITYNLLQENEAYGIRTYSGCDNNSIHHNNFVDNNIGGTSQARDEGTNNYWYDVETLEGNYWDDWSGTGYYAIDGTAGSSDLYPLDEPVVEINPPLIVNIIHSPSTPTELETISINATVTDDSGIHNVTLHYRVNGGTWTEVSMSLISGDIYSVTIGSFAAGSSIEYYVSAIDNSVIHNEATEDNGGLYYGLTVGSSDVTGPTIDNIIHSPVTPTELETISINATVTDDSGIHNVTLHYKVNSGTWTEISMTLISGDIYSVTIGSFTVSDTIEYYISAIDDSVNNNEDFNDNSGLYYSFTVVEVILEFQTFSLLLPAITLLFLICGLVVIQRRKR